MALVTISLATLAVAAAVFVFVHTAPAGLTFWHCHPWISNTKQMIAFGCWMLLAFQGCSKEGVDNREEGDVEFAKTAFFSMVNGSAAEDMIDWETFHAFGEDLGPEYKAIASDAEKAAARKSFLAGFSASTPNIKANPGGITHWRVQSENPSETVVAADMQLGPVLLITVSKRDGNRKIAAIDKK